jgi:hypothetical protein
MVFIRIRPRIQVWSYDSHPPCPSCRYVPAPSLQLPRLIIRIRIDGTSHHPPSVDLRRYQGLLGNYRGIKEPNASPKSYDTASTLWSKLIPTQEDEVAMC